LLSLQATLNDKELQSIKLWEQQICVVNKTTNAKKNWETFLKFKDHMIPQLQKALHHQKHALERFGKSSNPRSSSNFNNVLLQCS